MEKSCKNNLQSVQQPIFELHLSGVSCQKIYFHNALQRNFAPPQNEESCQNLFHSAPQPNFKQP